MLLPRYLKYEWKRGEGSQQSWANQMQNEMQLEDGKSGQTIPKHSMGCTSCVIERCVLHSKSLASDFKMEIVSGMPSETLMQLWVKDKESLKFRLNSKNLESRSETWAETCCCSLIDIIIVLKQLRIQSYNITIVVIYEVSRLIRTVWMWLH